ncbi:uncharacterized protein LOC119664120 [Teleopsis dalmanni]|uniref:uncharacterized protein LOC119664113 n=1 Tax=Teleopsis dalmanni TaxID=139649 RepID=UPI0018CCEEBF|nr:uncharacterized protein LOC119664113 [Teleopsis dalmanni]XP_037929605.1 uncharacterized protein LOC119664120 [Teleopsis dalmanni]
MPHDDAAPPEGVSLVQNFAQTEKLALMGCDANARHSLWESSKINDRGESLFDFILRCNLEICNKGGWEEVLDIALCSTSRSLAINDWRVSARNSFSNHKYIMFVMDIPIVAKQSQRNPRKANWDILRSLLSIKVNIAPAPINSIRKLEGRVNSLTDNIISSFEASCPRSYAKKWRPPWWNEKLFLLRRNARRAFSESYCTKVWTPYKDALRVYKKALRESRKLSWNSHCEQIESIKESARLAKMLANSRSCPSLINKVDGSPVKFLTESLSLLVATHFPGSSGDTQRYYRIVQPTLTRLYSQWYLLE